MGDIAALIVGASKLGLWSGAPNGWAIAAHDAHVLGSFSRAGWFIKHPNDGFAWLVQADGFGTQVAVCHLAAAPGHRAQRRALFKTGIHSRPKDVPMKQSRFARPAPVLVGSGFFCVRATKDHSRRTSNGEL